MTPMTEIPGGSVMPCTITSLHEPLPRNESDLESYPNVTPLAPTFLTWNSPLKVTPTLRTRNLPLVTHADKQ